RRDFTSAAHKASERGIAEREHAPHASIVTVRRNSGWLYRNRKSSAGAFAAYAAGGIAVRHGSPMSSACTSTRSGAGSARASVPSIRRCGASGSPLIVWRSCSPLFAARESALEARAKALVHLDQRLAPHPPTISSPCWASAVLLCS